MLVILAFIACFLASEAFYISSTPKVFAGRAFLDMKKKKGGGGGKSKSAKSIKGFAPKDIVPAEEVIKTNLDMIKEEDAERASLSQASIPAASVDDIFEKYGMKDADGRSASQSSAVRKTKEEAAKVSIDERPFGQEIMAGIGAKQQETIDKALVTLAFGSLAFCLLCGIGISASAFKVVFPNFEVDSNLDALITNVLDPAFTPALGVFFFFSISYGLWKFAQISSTATVYRE